jgi:cell filamentation protein
MDTSAHIYEMNHRGLVTPCVGVREPKYEAWNAETEYQPGSNDEVLRNLLGMTSRRQMDEVELRELKRTIRELEQRYDRDHRFTVGDISAMHELWLGGIYEWAGRYRQVNLSKGDFLFAAAGRIPELMERFEIEQLVKYTPCRFSERGRIGKALAETHVELVLIHPFRDGNGRVARMLATVMALQAGLPPLDFDDLVRDRKEEYFRAIQAGLDRNYTPMGELFELAIAKTVDSS